MFHFEEWPENGVPKDNKKLLKLISTVQDCKQRENNQQPIVVMCRYLCYFSIIFVNHSDTFLWTFFIKYF